MAVISARIDEKTKEEAENIADAIGVSLSTAINIFINRFVAEKGFPFQVSEPEKRQNRPLFTKEDLEGAVREAIRAIAINNDFVPKTPSSSYIDGNGQLKETN